MNIRLAGKDDLDAICALSFQINATHFEHVPRVFSAPGLPGRDRPFWDAQIGKEDALFLIAEKESRVVGFVTARVTQNTEISFLNTHKICRVGTIVVSEQLQGCGIGQQLMMAVESWALEQGAIEVRLEVMEFNKTAQDFYDKQGFQTQSRILMKSLE